MTLGSMDHGEGRAAQLVQLEPLIHQVSGHSSLWVLDDVTVCKPLIGREAKFYRTLPPQMRLFTPEFRGTLKVLVERTAEGVAVAALPPNAGERGYFASRRSSDHRTNRKKVNRVRACNVELASEGEEVGGEMAEEEEEEDNLHLPMIGPPIPGVMPAHNPWLKECHQRYLDKLKKKAESKVNVMECILLENLTHIYRVPNVLDLKMGTRQYGDDAPESKRRSQTRKAQHTTTPRLGVRLAGMQVYDRDAKSYVCKNKYVGRELSEDGFQQTLRHFLHNGRRFRTDIVDQIIAKLTDLRKVVGSLDSFRFFTSSLLILYDSFDTKGAPKGKDNMAASKDKENLTSVVKDNRIPESRSKENFSSCGRDKRATSSKDRDSFSASGKEKRNSTSKDKDSSLSSAKDKRISDSKEKDSLSACSKDRRADRDNRRGSREAGAPHGRSLKRSNSTTLSELPQIASASAATTATSSWLPHQNQETLQTLPENCSVSSINRELILEKHSSVAKIDRIKKDGLQNRVVSSLTPSAGDGYVTGAAHGSATSSSDGQSERRVSGVTPGNASVGPDFGPSIRDIAQQVRQPSDESVSISLSQRISSLPNEQSLLKEGIRPTVTQSERDRLATKDDKEVSHGSPLTNVDYVSNSKGSQFTTSNFVLTSVPSVSIQTQVSNTNVVASSIPDSIENQTPSIASFNVCTLTTGNFTKEPEILTYPGSSSSNFGPVPFSDNSSELGSKTTGSSKRLSCGSVNSSVIVNSSCSRDAKKNTSSSSLKNDGMLNCSSIEAHPNSSGTPIVPVFSQDAKIYPRLGSTGEQNKTADIYNKDITVPVQTCVTCHSSVPNTNSPSLSNNNIGLEPCQSLDNAEKALPNSVSIASSLDSIAKKPSPAIQATTCNNNPTDDICSVVSTTDSVVTGHINTYSPPSLDQGTAVSSSSFASSSSVQGSSLLNSTRSTSVASSDSACKTKVDIRLIDFAHATHKGMGDATIYSGPDEGLMLGLKSLINIFTDIKEYYAK